MGVMCVVASRLLVYFCVQAAKAAAHYKLAEEALYYRALFANYCTLCEHNACRIFECLFSEGWPLTPVLLWQADRIPKRQASYGP